MKVLKIVRRLRLLVGFEISCRIINYSEYDSENQDVDIIDYVIYAKRPNITHHTKPLSHNFSIV